MGDDDTPDEGDIYWDRRQEKAEFDAMLDMAAEGEAAAAEYAREELQRWASRILEDAQALEADAAALPAGAREAYERARAAIEGIDLNEVGEWGYEDHHTDDYGNATWRFWEAEEAYETAEYELARARVLRDEARMPTPPPEEPGPPEWAELRDRQQALFNVPASEVQSAASARRPFPPSERFWVMARAGSVARSAGVIRTRSRSWRLATSSAWRMASASGSTRRC